MAGTGKRPSQYAVLTATFQKEGRWMTAECQELGTTAFGRNVTEAERRLREAILLHLSTLEDVGERARFFKEHGIRTYPRYPKAAHPTIPTEMLSKAHVLKVGREIAFAQAS